MALLFSLRTLTLDAAYNFEFRCAHCGAFNKRTADLKTDLAQQEPAPDLTEPIKVHLTNLNKDVEIRFLRGKDEEAVAKYAKRIKMTSSDVDDPSLPHRIAIMLQTVDGEKMDILERERFVTNMPYGDLLDISAAVEAQEPGIDTEIVVDCSKCQSPSKVELAMNAEFFRRSARRA